MATTNNERCEWEKPVSLAEREGISRRTVWRWVQRGKLEVSRRGARAGVRVRTVEQDDR